MLTALLLAYFLKKKGKERSPISASKNVASYQAWLGLVWFSAASRGVPHGICTQLCVYRLINRRYRYLYYAQVLVADR